MLSDAVIVAIIVSVPTTISSILFGIAGIRSRNELKSELKGDIKGVSIQVDGRLTELLKLTKAASHAEGMKDQKDNPS